MLGIDVSKDTLAATLVDPQTRQPRWTQNVPRTEAGIRKLLARTPPTTAWVLEPTGSYSLSVVRQAQAAGRTVLKADPKAARHYLKSLSPRAKTDRIDSKGLALFALDRSLRPYTLKAAANEELDQLLAARKGLADAASRLKQQARELPHAAGSLKPAIETLQKQQRELERRIAERTKQEPQLAVARELDQVHGIGPITAATAASRLRAHSFARPDQWVAYVGLDIGIRESGKRKGEWGLTKQGDAELRRLFYLCAKSTVTRKNSPFAAQYQRELAKGLKKTAALCAVARKMARVVWSLFHHGTRYDPARIYSAQAA
jgi:transposase